MQLAGLATQQQMQAMDPLQQMQREMALKQLEKMQDVEHYGEIIRQRGDAAYRAFEYLWNKWGPETAVQTAVAQGEPKIEDWIKRMGGDPKRFESIIKGPPPR